MKTKITLVAILAVTTGAFLYTRPHSGIPSDLRDAVSDGAFGALKGGADASDINVPEPELGAVKAERGQAKAVKSAFSRLGRAPTDGGPLFGRVADMNAQAKEVDLRFGDESPEDVLKRMFEAGTQPKRKDLIGVVEGRAFALAKIRQNFLVGKEFEKVPDGGPLFLDKKGLSMANFFTSPEPACRCFKSGNLLDPVRIEDGSAIAEWIESAASGILKIRMNSGYRVFQATERRGDSVEVYYGYYFNELKCAK